MSAIETTAVSHACSKPSVTCRKRVSDTETSANKYPRVSLHNPEAGAFSKLWTDEFSPTKVGDIVGNSSAIATLRTWLSEWSAVMNGAEENAKRISRRAVLISGPPGIGKTTSAALLCKELGFQFLNINASDSRGKSGKVEDGIASTLASTVREFITNHSICSGNIREKKSALIMDEVDGMAGGDRGGLAELIEMIKRTRIPIICICNDRHAQKLKTLVNYCVDLPFQRPNKLQLRKRLVHVANLKNLDINIATIDDLIESNNNDIRSSINQLQLWNMVSGGDKSCSSSKKDVATNVFQAIDVVLRPSSCSLDVRLRLAFQHGDLLPLFVQENYPFMRPKESRSDLERLVRLAAAASRVSEGDIFLSAINRTQNWTLLPEATMLCCIIPSSAVRGSRETFNQGERNSHRFPSSLGKMSTRSKSVRLLHDVHNRMRSSGVFKSSAREFSLSYAYLTKKLLTQPLYNQNRNGKDVNGLPDVINFMKTYQFAREDWDSIQEITKFSGKGPSFEDPAAHISTTVKSAFTRACKRSL